MSYQYNNIPNVEDAGQEGGAPVPTASGDNSMAYPPNANANNAQQQPPPPVNVNQQPQQQPQTQQQPQGVQQQQPYGGARAYMPTYHEYMQSNTNTYGNGVNVNSGIGMSGYPSSFGSYGPNVGSTAWTNYIQHSKRNRIMVAMVIGIFLLLVTTHSNSGASNQSSSSSSSSSTPTITNPTGTNSHQGIAGDGKGNVVVNNNNNNNNSNSNSNGPPAASPADSTSSSSTSNNNNNNNANSETADDTKENSLPAADTYTSTDPDFNLAYLLTYPMSGTSYTMFMVSRSTNRTVATNYFGDAQFDVKTKKPIPIVPNGEDLGSPYWWGYGKEYYQTKKPKVDQGEYVLTLTHCGGWCLHPCAAYEYIQSTSLFEESCRFVFEAPEKNTEVAVITPKRHVKEIVHLIRDPFSNVVSRFHQYRMHHVTNGDRTNHNLNRDHSDKGSMGSFQEWCKELDSEKYIDDSPISSPFISIELKELMKNIPCHTEFFKYVAWHNHVVEMSWNENYPTKHVYFEDYNNHGDDANDHDYKHSEKVVAQGLAEFLKTPINEEEAGLPPWLKVNMYKHYYTDAQQADVQKFVEAMALTKTYELLKRYFEG